MRIFGENKNVVKLKIKNESGRVFDGIYFGDSGEFISFLEEKFGHEKTENFMLGYPINEKIDVVYYPEINEFRGRKSLQINIRSFR